MYVITLVIALLFTPTVAWAHDGDAPSQLPDIWVVSTLVLTTLLYARGVWATWRRAGRGRGISVSQACLFAAGALTIAIAALSPLHVLGLTSFAAHMLEHELLMVVAAPLYAASRPLSAFLRALPEGVRFSLNNLGHTGVVSAIWRTISHPLFATLFHGLVLWVWHVPGLFEAALKLESVHRFQHVAFMGSALLFWWSLSPDGNWRRVNGSSIFYLFFTSLHSAILGMLLALTPRLWYQSYARDTGFGLAPIEDQQVAGLLMWVPTSLIYTACALVLTTLWVRRSAKSKLSYARP